MTTPTLFVSQTKRRTTAMSGESSPLSLPASGALRVPSRACSLGGSATWRILLWQMVSIGEEHRLRRSALDDSLDKTNDELQWVAFWVLFQLGYVGSIVCVVSYRVYEEMVDCGKTHEHVDFAYRAVS